MKIPARLTLAKTISISLGLLLTLLLLFCYFAYYADWIQYRQNKAHIRKLTKSYRAQQRQLNHLKKINGSWKQPPTKPLIKISSINQLTVTLIQFVKKYHLALQQIQPQINTYQTTKQNAVIIMKSHGDYQHIIAFIKRLEKLPLWVVINEVKISHSPSQPLLLTLMITLEKKHVSM